MSKKLADTIVLPLRTRIQKCVEKSAGDSSEMSSLIRTVYREWKMQQIDKLVSDIARLAYSRGAYLVLDAGTKVCWMVDPDGPACSDAEDNSLAGTISLGENFPTGHEHPVVHSGCRCLVVPAPASLCFVRNPSDLPRSPRPRGASGGGFGFNAFKRVEQSGRLFSQFLSSVEFQLEAFLVFMLTCCGTMCWVAQIFSGV